MKSHKHRCPECSLVWEHPDDTCAKSMIACMHSHTCPRCGMHSHTCPRCGWEHDSEMVGYGTHLSTYLKYRGPVESDIIFFGPHKPKKEIQRWLRNLQSE